MALVPKGNESGYFVSLTIMDNQSDLSTMSFETSATDETEAQAILDLLFAEMPFLTAGQVVGTSIRKDLVENNPVNNAGSDVSIKAKVTVLLTGGTKKAVLTIPAPNEGIFAAASGPNNNIVDVEDTNLNDFVAVFGATAPGNGALISDGETIDDIISGRRTSVSRRSR